MLGNVPFPIMNLQNMAAPSTSMSDTEPTKTLSTSSSIGKSPNTTASAISFASVTSLLDTNSSTHSLYSAFLGATPSFLFCFKIKPSSSNRPATLNPSDTILYATKSGFHPRNLNSSRARQASSILPSLHIASTAMAATTDLLIRLP